MLIENASLRKTLGQNAKEYIKNTASIDIVTNDYVQIIDKIAHEIQRKKNNVDIRNKLDTTIVSAIRELLI